ncbi:MAG: InlB B-repeat-containing protein [Lachnospiraceae bacterium]
MMRTQVIRSNDIIGAKQYEYDNNVNIKNTQNSNGTQADAVPVETGYTFAGWNTKADGTGTALL